MSKISGFNAVKQEVELVTWLQKNLNEQKLNAKYIKVHTRESNTANTALVRLHSPDRNIQVEWT